MVHTDGVGPRGEISALEVMLQISSVLFFLRGKSEGMASKVREMVGWASPLSEVSVEAVAGWVLWEANSGMVCAGGTRGGALPREGEGGSRTGWSETLSRDAVLQPELGWFFRVCPSWGHARSLYPCASQSVGAGCR